MTGRCRTCPEWDDDKNLGYAPGWGLCHQEFSRHSLVKVIGVSAIRTHAAFGCVMHPENGGAGLVADNMVMESRSEGMKTCFQRDSATGR